MNSSPAFRMPEDRFLLVGESVSRAISSDAFPGAVVLAAREGRVELVKAFGHRAVTNAFLVPKDGSDGKLVKPAMQEEVVFDIGSLSGTLCVTAMMMRLVEEGLVKLDDRVVRYLQGFGVHGKSEITIRHLLSHTAGFPASLPFFEEFAKVHGIARLTTLTSRSPREFVLHSLLRSTIKTKPGTKHQRSEVDFVALGFIIEAATGMTLDKALRKLVAHPLGMRSVGYIDLDRIRRREISPAIDLIAPGEECQWRKRILCGEVSDDTSWIMGGIAGHAGVFAAALDLHVLTNELIKAMHGESSWVSQEVAAEFIAPPEEEDAPIGAPSALGFDVPSRANRMIESGLTLDARGGIAETGCSVWFEPEERISVMLLTNRLHPTRAGRTSHNFVPEIFRERWTPFADNPIVYSFV